MTTPRLHRSQRLSYVLASPTKASTTSGAMNSALPTGVRSCGVARGELSELLNFMPDPRSKSQIFTGVSWSRWTQRMFSGFRSRWAIPTHKTRCSTGIPNYISINIAYMIKYWFTLWRELKNISLESQFCYPRPYKASSTNLEIKDFEIQIHLAFYIKKHLQIFHHK